MDNPIEPACAGTGLVDSLTNDELPFPEGYDPMCTGCRLLCGMYGPEDGELISHLAHDHIDPDLDSDPIPFVVPFDVHIENITYSLTEYHLIPGINTGENSTTTNK